jgi:hypothetical protein
MTSIVLQFCVTFIHYATPVDCNLSLARQIHRALPAYISVHRVRADTGIGAACLRTDEE